MEIKRQVKFELTGKDIEEIVTAHISERMANIGYTLDYTYHDEPIPDMTFRGIASEAVEEQYPMMNNAHTD